jgi:predicted nuclease of predicted toxin-antitoxin system
LRFLVDQCLSGDLAEGLVAAGHDAVHVAAYGLSRAGDDEILARAAHEDRVLISADTDFGGLLAARGATLPSVILDRRRTRRRPHEQVMVLLANLGALEEDLNAGAIAVIDDRGIRIRRLPIGG